MRKCGHVCYSGCWPLQNESCDHRRGEWVLYDKLCTVLLAVLRKMGTFMAGINHVTAVSYVQTAFVRLDIHSAWHPTSLQACHYDMLILLGTVQTGEFTAHASFIISGTKQIVVAAVQLQWIGERPALNVIVISADWNAGFWTRSKNCEKRLLASWCLSVCPSVRMKQFCSHWADDIWYLNIFFKLSRKINAQ